MNKKEIVREVHLNEEWAELVKEAMKSNITKEEFKRFLVEKKKKEYE
jgi:hypothetical protein